MENQNLICPHCGAQLIFSQDTQQHFCPYCDSVFSFSNQSSSSEDFYENIVKLVCNFNCIINEEVYTGKSLRELDFFQKAKKHFEIPDEEDCCMIYNSSIVRLFRTGFALCSTGLYYRLGKKKLGKLTYKQLKNSEIFSLYNDLYINELCFISFSGRGPFYKKLFKEIQKLIPSNIT